MNYSPRLSICILGLCGLLYQNPPANWLNRQSLEEEVSKASHQASILTEAWDSLMGSSE
jgi:hypothetical protein